MLLFLIWKTEKKNPEFKYFFLSSCVHSGRKWNSYSCFHESISRDKSYSDNVFNMKCWMDPVDECSDRITLKFQWSHHLLPTSYSLPSNIYSNLMIFLWTTIPWVFQQSSCSGRSTIHGEIQRDSPSWIEAIILRLIMTLPNYNWKHNAISWSKLVKKQSIICLPCHLVS